MWQSQVDIMHNSAYISLANYSLFTLNMNTEVCVHVHVGNEIYSIIIQSTLYKFYT